MGLTVFRFLGDIIHIISIAILILKMRRQKSCAGLSLRTQEAFAIAYTCRYLDLLWSWTGTWNFCMKVLLLWGSWWLVWAMRTRYRGTYNREYDTFRPLFLYAPCAVLALLIHKAFTPFELLWAFSLYVEAVAILPQLFLLQRTGEHEAFTLDYIAALGAYRAFYLLNWIWRAFTESSYGGEWIVWLAGLVQTGLYCDFFYYYAKSRWYGGAFKLPG